MASRTVKQAEQKPDFQAELVELLQRHDQALIVVAISPSGAPVPIGDFVPQGWTVQIKAGNNGSNP